MCAQGAKRKQERTPEVLHCRTGEDCAIFGYLWLKSFNSGINWDKGQVLEPPVMVEMALLKWVKKQNVQKIVATATFHKVWDPEDKIIANIMQIPSHTAQQWAIEVNKNKPKNSHILPKEYQHYEQIFLKTGTERFSPS